MSRRIKELEEETRQLRVRLGDSERELRDAKARIHGMQSALHSLRGEHTTMTTLLDVKTSELRAAESFLARVEGHSDADVMRRVQELNVHIFQVSAQIADFLPTLAVRTPSSTDNLDDQKKDEVERLAGRTMIQLLSSRQYSGDSICIQMTLQACMATYLSMIVRAWTQGNANSELLNKVHTKMYENEPQPVSGRWRALTRSYL